MSKILPKIEMSVNTGSCELRPYIGQGFIISKVIVSRRLEMLVLALSVGLIKLEMEVINLAYNF